MTSKKDIISAARTMGKSYKYEEGHSNHVAATAVKLFDALKELHGLGKRERLLLEVAGILHDTGWIKGQKKHHKTSMNLILSSDLPGIDDDERTMIALIARYHRRAHPKDTHPHYSDLPDEKKAIVRTLSGMLRLADGLDRTHLAVARDLSARISPRKITLRVEGRTSETDRTGRKEKRADLLEAVTGREIEIDWP